MNLQDYVKYLVCIVAANLVLVHCQNVYDTEVQEDDAARQERGVLDLLFGRLRTCGGCLCGRPNRNGARLLAGEYTASHEYPWLANIHLKSEKLVSGVLINDRYVLTAASQVTGLTSPDVKISLGVFDRCTLDVSSTNFSVEAVIPYPEYNPDSHAHDLALIRLSRPTQFERRISPVCLPNPGMEIYVRLGSTYLGQVGTLSGWAAGDAASNDDNNSRSCRPRKVGLPILGRNECIKSGIDAANFNDDSGCAGVLGANSIVCENDAGSSLLYRSYAGIYDLVGILSDVNTCNGKPGTAVFTRVGPHLDWLLQQTKDACYCTK